MVLGQEMIKLVVLNDRVVGAILIGETDLEEAIENIILNRFYVGDMKGYLLDPEFNLEDYFDWFVCVFLVQNNVFIRREKTKKLLFDIFLNICVYDMECHAIDFVN